MFPKEHGAWNALLVSLAAGWFALGEWNDAAFFASLFWLSGFTARAPFSTARQYWKADPPKAYRAVFFFLILFFVFFVSGCLFLANAPLEDINLATQWGLPIGSLIFILVAGKKNLRHWGIEVIGFTGLTLLTPVLYLSKPSAGLTKAYLLFMIFGGYFILAVFYVKVRQAWVAMARTGKVLRMKQRAWDGSAIFLVHVMFVAIVLAVSRIHLGMAAGPLYALARTFAGLMWGKPHLPLMKLGMREMIHSIIYTVVVFYFWFFP